MNYSILLQLQILKGPTFLCVGKSGVAWEGFMLSEVLSEMPSEMPSEVPSEVC